MKRPLKLTLGIVATITPSGLPLKAAGSKKPLSSFGSLTDGSKGGNSKKKAQRGNPFWTSELSLPHGLAWNGLEKCVARNALGAGAGAEAAAEGGGRGS